MGGSWGGGRGKFPIPRVGPIIASKISKTKLILIVYSLRILDTNDTFHSIVIRPFTFELSFL